jgi:hypothetical protein
VLDHQRAVFQGRHAVDVVSGIAKEMIGRHADDRDRRDWPIVSEREGKLLSLPRDDWPPGCARDQRSLQLSRMAAEDRGSLMLAIQKLFELPAQPAELLLQHENVPHARIDVDRKVCAVYVCKMRQILLKHGLKIKTIWGYGYQLSQEHRHKAMDLILSRVALP